MEGPNYLWHIDTNHKLVRWHLIIAAGIDGFSRLVVYLQCTENNQADTMLSCFLTGVKEFGLPIRVRTDKGMENVRIADYMIHNRGSNQSSILVGKSVHNQRIERLWRDVFDGVLCFYYHLFYFMEDSLILDPLNDIHIAALHHVFLSKINERLYIWKKAWATHRLRTVKSSPICLWSAGQYNNQTDIDFATADVQNTDEHNVELHVRADGQDSRPVIESPTLVLSEQCKQQLLLQCPLAWTSSNFGIDVYLTAVDIITSFLPGFN